MKKYELQDTGWHVLTVMLSAVAFLICALWACALTNEYLLTPEFKEIFRLALGGTYAAVVVGGAIFGGAFGFFAVPLFENKLNELHNLDARVVGDQYDGGGGTR